MIPVSFHTLGIDTTPTIDLTIDTGVIPTIGLEAIQIVKISDIKKKIEQEIIQTVDQTTEDLAGIINKIDHKITHKIETQILKTDKDTIPSHLIGIITFF